MSRGIYSLRKVGMGWKEYQAISRSIYKDAKTNEFGYYAYSSDQLEYPEKYAMSYTQKEFPKIKASLNSKRRETYLIIAPPVPDRPYLDGKWWKKREVRMPNRTPDMKVQMFDGTTVEKYILNDTEISVSSDPNLNQNLIFR